MSNIKIELNSSGVKELLKSAEMGAICKELADEIADRCGGESGHVYTGPKRVNVSVYSDKFDNSLLSALK